MLWRKNRPADEHVLLVRLVQALERQANGLEKLAHSLEPLRRAALLVPNRRDRIKEALCAALSINQGDLPDIATIERKANELERHMDAVFRLGNGGE